jgi:hypothetical protein
MKENGLGLGLLDALGNEDLLLGKELLDEESLLWPFQEI